MDLVSAVEVRDGSARAVWMALLVVCGAGLSLVFACATPFAALAALAALKVGRRDALLTVGLVWLVNQVVGYAFLGYPVTWDSFAWGGAIGVAALAALVAAGAMAPRRSAGLAVSLPFVAGFAGFELVLYLAAGVLPSEVGAFGLGVVRELLVVNAVALVGLLAVHPLVMAGVRALGTAGGSVAVSR
jgi:hypothetical protein